jgi:hypothetical protein
VEIPVPNIYLGFDTISGHLVCYMRVKLTYIEKDFRGKELANREEVLQGESAKSLTRNHVARLIARHHPELASAGGMWLLDASETAHKWYIRATRLDTNRWLYVYADPIDPQS